MPSLVSRVTLVAFGGLVVVGSALGLAAPAQAHNYLVSSTPDAGSTLTELPDTFDITTNDLLFDTGGGGNGFALQIRDSAGLYFEDGCVSIDGPSMTAAPSLGAPGDYTVLWQVVSADGHSVSGEIPFTWAPADADAAVSTGSAGPAVCGDHAITGAGATSGGAPASGAGEAGTAQSDDPAASDDAVSSDGIAGSVSASSTSPSGSSDLLWIGGTIGALALATGITVLAVRRRRT